LCYTTPMKQERYTILIIGALLSVITISSIGISDSQAYADEDFSSGIINPKEEIYADAPKQQQLQQQPVSIQARKGLTESLSTNEAAAKNIFSKASDRMSVFVRSLSSAIGKAHGINAERKEAMIEKLTDDVEFIQREGAQLKIAGTKEQLRNKVQGIKNFWAERIGRLRSNVGVLLSARVSNAVTRLYNLNDKINILLERLKSQNVDITALLEQQNLFVDEIDAAEQKLQDAKSSFESISESSTQEEHKQLFSEGNASLKEGHEHLRAAHNIFKDLIKQIRTELPALPDATSETSTPTSQIE